VCISAILLPIEFFPRHPNRNMMCVVIGPFIPWLQYRLLLHCSHHLQIWLHHPCHRHPQRCTSLRHLSSQWLEQRQISACHRSMWIRKRKATSSSMRTVCVSPKRTWKRKYPPAVLSRELRPLRNSNKTLNRTTEAALCRDVHLRRKKSMALWRALPKKRHRQELHFPVLKLTGALYPQCPKAN
jgi:hypothetical protein